MHSCELTCWFVAACARNARPPGGASNQLSGQQTRRAEPNAEPKQPCPRTARSPTHLPHSLTFARSCAPCTAVRLCRCVSGCPKEEEPREAAARMARMAQDMIHCVANFKCPIPGVKLKIRIGLHSGALRELSGCRHAGHGWSMAALPERLGLGNACS